MPTSWSSSPFRRCWAEIDLAALERNLGQIRNALPAGIAYVAVVKADAYGHGLQPASSRLMQSGADLYAVANVEEAARLREIGTGWPILLLSPLLPEEDRALLDLDLAATLSNGEEARRLNQLAGRAGRAVRVHLKIDTGMGRLGVWHEQAVPLYREITALPHLKLEGIYTHFSSADKDPEYTQLQRGRFFEALNSFEIPANSRIWIHADNSAGLDTFRPDSPVNAVRIGLLQFGIPPRRDSLLSAVHVEPVFSLHSRIGLIKRVPAGTSLSYGRTYRTLRETRLGILTAGYGDGIPLGLSNRGHVLIRGQRCSIVGRVTMDQTLVDLTDAPGSKTGDPATFIGRQEMEEIDLATFASIAGTLPYQALTAISSRVARVYTTNRDI